MPTLLLQIDPASKKIVSKEYGSNSKHVGALKPCETRFQDVLGNFTAVTCRYCVKLLSSIPFPCVMLARASALMTPGLVYVLQALSGSGDQLANGQQVARRSYLGSTCGRVHTDTGRTARIKRQAAGTG